MSGNRTMLKLLMAVVLCGAGWAPRVAFGQTNDAAEREPKRTEIAVVTTPEARIHVDGRFVGVAPLDHPIEVEPGTHRVSVSMNGHLPHVEEVTLKRGSSRTLEIELSATRQRIGAWFLITSGAVGVATGIVFGALALADPAYGKDANQPSAKGVDWRVLSGFGAGVGLGLSFAGGILFTFDEPTLSLGAPGPGEVGATARVRF
jgi:hypothetical protein